MSLISLLNGTLDGLTVAVGVLGRMAPIGAARLRGLQEVADSDDQPSAMCAWVAVIGSCSPDAPTGADRLRGRHVMDDVEAQPSDSRAGADIAGGSNTGGSKTGWLEPKCLSLMMV